MYDDLLNTKMYRYNLYQMKLMELLSSGIITQYEFDIFNFRILRLIRESEVLNGKNEKDAKCSK